MIVITLDHCSSNPCQNGATCINDGEIYTCYCAELYDGNNCENLDVYDENDLCNGTLFRK